MDAIRIETKRFLLRPLTPEDATERYAAWFGDPEVQRHIVSAASAPSVAELREYIAARAGRPDAVFLGIYTRDAGVHIGNIKYEPIDRAASRAELGILIGEPDWRGRGVATEVIVAANEWMAAHRGIGEVVLGVESAHTGAKRAYTKAGFEVLGRHEAGPIEAIKMIWRSPVTRA